MGVSLPIVTTFENSLGSRPTLDLVKAASSVSSCQEVFRELWSPQASNPLETKIPDISYLPITDTEWKAVFAALSPEVFKDEPFIDLSKTIPEEHKKARMALLERFGGTYRFNIGIFEGSTIIGWCWGRQERPDELHMVNTGILPEKQNNGIYQPLLREVLEIARQAGFQKVTSWHRGDNDRIFHIKEKAGFVLSGSKIWEAHGLLWEMSYFFSEERRAIFEQLAKDTPLPQVPRYFQNKR